MIPHTHQLVCEKHEPSELDIATNDDGDSACLICILELFYEHEMIPTDPCPMCGGLMELKQTMCSRCKRYDFKEVPSL